jgi:ankyrin repeat protein
VLTRLPFHAPIARYHQQAAQLLSAKDAAEPWALRLFHDEVIPTRPGRIEPSKKRDAALALARWYDFRDYPALEEFAASVADPASPVHQFEAAAESVIQGDIETLTQLLHTNPELTQARSTRVTQFDPPIHGATLLHYLSANGVEGYRQLSPANAPIVAQLLLQSGAAPDATANCYGGAWTTLALLVSSTPPAQAGVQCALVETLVAHGANVDGRTLITALTFNFQAAAETLVRLGAPILNVATAAGLGLAQETARLLLTSDPPSRHRALALAAHLGHAETTRILLDAGEDPNRYNPPQMHEHSTPLHQAALAGHFDVVRLLVEHGARLDIEDAAYHGTPLGWAEHGGQTDVANYLRSKAS